MASVLLTRPRKLSETLAAQLQADGWAVYIAPMLEYQDTGTPLPDTSDYDALVFTSAEAVRGFERQRGGNNLPVYAVGSATAEAARLAGFTTITTAAGTLADLNTLLTKTERLLHISGADIAGDVTSKTVTVDRHIIYKAEAVSEISADVEEMIRAANLDAVLFFSPRSAAQFSSLIQKTGLENHTENMDAYCFSAAVAESLKPLSFRKLEIAEKTELSSIVTLLNRSKS